MSEQTPQTIGDRIRRISHVRWFSRWPGFGPLHQSLKLSILQKFFIPNAVVIETGTSSGRTALALSRAGHFVHTIEVDAGVHDRALTRLRNEPNIRVHLGDSGAVMPTLLDEIVSEARAVNFWLDGHYCGEGSGTADDHDTAIVPELAKIRQLADDGIEVVVAVDDFRLFGNDPAYPTKDFLVAWASAAKLHWYIVGDIFIATARQHLDV